MRTIMTNVPTDLWVRRASNNRDVINPSTQVSTENCKDVDDVISAVKSVLSNQLKEFDDDMISLHLTENGAPLRRSLPLTELSSQDGYVQNTEETPLYVHSVPSLERIDQIDQEIKALENSEEYKTLAIKNRTWAVPKPTDEEKSQWQYLKETLAELKKGKEFYQDLILSMYAHSGKKSDETRKGYKKDTAIKDERLLLSDIAIKMWARFKFPVQHFNRPTFGDFQWAAGFKDDFDVYDYFQKKEEGLVKEDLIKDSLTEEQWIWLIGLNQRVNQLLHNTLITNQDGSLRLVLEHDVYQDGVYIAEELVRALYGSKKVNIIDAASYSSNSK